MTRQEFTHPAMGTLFRIVLFAPSEDLGARAAAAAFDRIDEIESVATDYRAESEARSLSSATDRFQRLSPDLSDLVVLSAKIHRASGGAFDPTIGALTREWRRALRRSSWPAQDRWSKAAAAVGFDRLVETRTVGQGLSGGGAERPLELRVRHGAMRLDFGGVAKGYAVDEALDALAAFGVHHALVDGGGDLAARRPPPGKRGWNVSVQPLGDAGGREPMRFVLACGAIATSGDAYQVGALQGAPLTGLHGSAERFGHVLDPRTRLPLDAPRAAVVVSSTAAEADAWATALMVLGDEGVRQRPEGQLQPSLNNGAPPEALRMGIFFRGAETEPCAGDLFPHDGVVHLTPTPE